MGTRIASLPLALLLCACASRPAAAAPASTSLVAAQATVASLAPAANPTTPPAAPAPTGTTPPGESSPSPSPDATADDGPAEDGAAIGNNGQHIYFSLDHPVFVYYGEAGYVAPALQSVFYDLARYTLNGSAAAARSVACIKTLPPSGGCIEFRLDLADGILVEGQSYELAAGDEVIGTFIARNIEDTTAPEIVSATLTQHELTVAYSEPMAGSRCAESYGGGILDRSNYRTDSDILTYALSLPNPVTASDDCTAVTFSMRMGIPPGRYRLAVGGASDLAGNAASDQDFEFDVPDEGPPSALSVFQESPYDYGLAGDREVLRLVFDEPLDPRSVADVSRYVLNGAPLAAGATAACEGQACYQIILGLPARSVRSRDLGQNTLSAPAVRDLVGNPAGESGTIVFWGN